MSLKIDIARIDLPVLRNPSGRPHFDAINPEIARENVQKRIGRIGYASILFLRPKYSARERQPVVKNVPFGAHLVILVPFRAEILIADIE